MEQEDQPTQVERRVVNGKMRLFVPVGAPGASPAKRPGPSAQYGASPPCLAPGGFVNGSSAGAPSGGPSNGARYGASCGRAQSEAGPSAVSSTGSSTVSSAGQAQMQLDTASACSRRAPNTARASASAPISASIGAERPGGSAIALSTAPRLSTARADSPSGRASPSAASVVSCSGTSDMSVDDVDGGVGAASRRGGGGLAPSFTPSFTPSFGGSSQQSSFSDDSASELDGGESVTGDGDESVAPEDEGYPEDDEEENDDGLIVGDGAGAGVADDDGDDLLEAALVAQMDSAQ